MQHKGKIFKINLALALSQLSGCSVGTWWRVEKEVERTPEIPLCCVPWVSRKQQQEEGRKILPDYLTLKRRQEIAQQELKCQFNTMDTPKCK
ncbi:hypothetical protein P618_201109 [Holospora obtusa F1]|uniref:Uncharacterized protein n=1 Tax=Holospora obtusa F1 TaxID=1399147 RepID=W6TDM5_HOLOB|nr:hypothetical protein [Holospora obtusa]ETZ06704.1 hypothetical protein P618_201109 [Holospora obtusa F1]